MGLMEDVPLESGFTCGADEQRLQPSEVHVPKQRNLFILLTLTYIFLLCHFFQCQKIPGLRLTCLLSSNV